MGKPSAQVAEIRNLHKFLVERNLMEKSGARPKHAWEGNNKMGLKDTK
jgi:hypothetical protein